MATARKFKPTRTRNALYARVAIARKALGMAEDDYRAMLAGGWGAASAAELAERPLQELCNALEKQANTGVHDSARRPHPGRPKNMGGDESRARQMKKIEALLAEAEREWPYADALAQRICKVQKVAWVKQHDLYKIIAALTKDAQRHGRRTW